MRTWAVTSAAIALLGPFAGLLWAAVAPTVRYLVVRGEALPADPEGQGPIGIDGWYALICAVAGLLCGALAYWRGGRGNDVPLLLGLTTGGLAAALLAAYVGHRVGLSGFERSVAAATDGAGVTGVAELRARGLAVIWPLLAVGLYGVLELLVKRLPAGDRRRPGAGEPQQVGGGELDLEAAPAGRDVDGAER
ncbi:hypothetical protein [Actinomadura hibisca]|uniref:hypothetical protein n=1 Tax=Actinomadura hibisca TaxID=68565 RepID=UPI0012F9EC10|nr:hypothetical protein [Actinomadura hibisca]